MKLAHDRPAARGPAPPDPGRGPGGDISKARQFAGYIPALILRRLRADPVPPAGGAGEVFPAAALFADIAGSTRLANELGRLGRLVGPEEMCRILNAYYGPLVSLLLARGGDVIGFAGDAVLAVWPGGDGGLGPAVAQAAQAGLEVQRDLNDKEIAPGVRLRLRVCVGAGELSTALVTGPQQFWQLVAYGPPLDQIRQGGKAARIGAVYLSAEAAGHLGGAADLERHADGGGFVRGLEAPTPAGGDVPDPESIPEAALRAFVPEAVRAGVDAGQGEYLAQSRPVTTIFVRVYRPAGTTPTWQRIQAAMGVLQETAARFDGTVVQLMEDDKGLIAVLAFGVPPRAHEDDPVRAASAAGYLGRRAREWDIQCSVGISTGTPFCGPLGSAERRIYTPTGTDMIRAARLMEFARPGDVLCDEATAERCGPPGPALGALPRVRMKGYDEPLRVFRVAPQPGEDCRAGELARVVAALDGGSPPRLIWVEGAEGSGAGRLIAAVRERMAGRYKRLGGPTAAEGAAAAPWADVWADLLGVRGERDPVQLQDRVAAYFASRPELAGRAAALADVPGAWPGGAGDAAGWQDLLLDLVADVARQRPVLLILPDAHRFGAADWSLARRAAALDGPVTLLLTAEPRDDAPAGWAGLRDDPATVRVTLPRLDDGAVERLAAGRLGAGGLGARLAALLRERGRGQPEPVECECERLLAAGRLVIAEGVCELVEEGAAAPAPRAARASPLVGRVREKLALARALDEAWAGDGRVVMLEGEPGLGKSRLLGRLREMAADRAMLTAAGHCSAVESATPYFPWRAVLEELLGLAGLTDPADRDARVLEAAARCPAARPFLPLVNDVLGCQLPDPGGVAGQLSGQARADNLNDVLTGLLAAAADGRPTLVALEDANHADSASWRLARLARERVPRLTVALSFCNAGAPLPPEYDLFAAAPWAAHLRLGPLSDAETAELARARLGAAEMTPALEALIRKRTQGNPLFVEQVVDHLAAGLVELRGRTAALKAPPEAVGSAVPDTVRGLVTARVDRLDLPCQLTAKVSSVVGPLFAGRVLAAVHPDAEALPKLAGQVAVLLREQFLRQDHPEPEPAFSFPHPVTQQVCYELLPRAQRRALHRRAAEWYEFEASVGATAPQHRLIAHHWGRADAAARQAEYLARAAEAALRDGAYREAVTGYGELIRLSRERFGAAPPPDEAARRGHWECQLGEAHFGVGDLPAAAEHLRAGLAWHRRPPRRSPPGLALDTIVQALRQAARRLFRARPAPAADRAAALESSAAYARLAQVHYFATEILAGTNATLRAANLAELAGTSPELARCYASLAIVCGLLRWHSAARAYERMAEAVARAAGHLPTLVTVSTYLGMYELGQGGWARVDALAREGLGLAERLGDLRQGAEAAVVLAMAGCFRGDYAGAAGWFERVGEFAARSENAMHTAWYQNGVGECLLRQGRSEEAAAWLRRSAAALEGNQDRAEEVRIEGMLAALAARAGDLEAAAAHADAALRLAALCTATTCSTLEGFAGAAEARFAAAEARPADRALRRAARAACSALRKHARVFPVGRPRLALFDGRRLWLAGCRRRARRAWRAGLAEAERLGMPFDAALIHDCLGRRLPAGSPERRLHLQAAARLYERVGAAHELALLAGADGPAPPAG